MMRLSRWTCLPMLLLLAHAALAQIPGFPSKPEAAATQPAELKSIPIAEIPQRADEDEAFVLELIERGASASAGKTSALGNELAVLKRNVVALEAKIQGDRLAALPLANLETLDRYLRFLDRELRALQAELQQGVRPTTEAAAEIVHRRKLWLDTREAIADDQLPTLMQRIDGLLKQFAQAETALAQPLALQLTLSRDTAATLARTGKAMGAVRAQIAGIDRKLWQRDAVGLFSALGQADLPRKFSLGALADDLRAEVEFMDEFDRSFGGINTTALLLGLLSLPVFIVVSLRARKAISANPALLRHPLALMRPVSAWLLLWLATLVLINFLGPTTMLKFLLALAWVPIMRLQPERMRRLVGGWIYLSGVFLLLHLFGQLVGGLTLLYRLAVLLNGLLMLLALGGLLWRLRRAGAAPPSRLQRTVHLLAVAGSAAIAVAVVANLAGNISLAAMLTDATLMSGYIGLFLLAAGSVVRSWAAFVFRPVAEKLMAAADQAGGLLPVASRLFDFGLMLAWLYGTLEAFRILRPLQTLLTQVFAWRVEFGNVAITAGGTVLFIVSVFLSFWVAKTVRGILFEDVLPRMSLPRGVANSASTITYYLLLMLGLVVALAAAGFEVSQLAIVLGALTLGIGLGLQSVVNNFVSGLILMFERPIQPGDTVRGGGHGRHRARHRHARHHLHHLRRRRRGGAQRHAAVGEADQLDAEHQHAARRHSGGRGLWQRSGAGQGLVAGGGPAHRRRRAPAAAGGAVHRLRREFAGFQRACLDLLRRPSHRAQHARAGHPRGAEGRRHRDPVRATGSAPAQCGCRAVRAAPAQGLSVRLPMPNCRLRRAHDPTLGCFNPTGTAHVLPG